MNLSEGWRQLKELKENTDRNQNYFMHLMENLLRTLFESFSVRSSLLDTLLKSQVTGREEVIDLSGIYSLAKRT